MEYEKKRLPQEIDNIQIEANNAKIDTCSWDSLKRRNGEYFDRGKKFSGICQEDLNDGKTSISYIRLGMEFRTSYYDSLEVLFEEIDTDSTGVWRVRRFFSNGNLSYEMNLKWKDHRWEYYYESGSIRSKVGFGYVPEDRDFEFYDADTKRLYDSLWLENGEIDTVRYYSKSSIIY
ncbi:hypothetical protein KFE98_19605 [bacterium SCSIO 12741]|nr:hypothetical protein KFE98_19605 [bacterium SCSIO 12741]